MMPIIRRMLRWTAFVMSAAVGVSACGGPLPVAMPEISFTGEPVLRLEAETPASIINEYRAPLTAPHIEHNYRIAPGMIARTWLRSRVALSGNGGEVRLTIHDASVREQTMEERGGLFGAFGSSKARRLVGTIDVTLDYVAPEQAAASVQARVEVARDLDKGAGEREIEIAYFELLKELADAFDAEMKARINEAFRPVLRQAA